MIAYAAAHKMNAINCSTMQIVSNHTAGIQRMYSMTAVKPYPLQTPQLVTERYSASPYIHKQCTERFIVSYTTFSIDSS